MIILIAFNRDHTHTFKSI